VRFAAPSDDKWTIVTNEPKLTAIIEMKLTYKYLYSRLTGGRQSARLGGELAA
jgi:hypothetical protein